MSWIRLIAGNLLVLGILLLTAEVLLRVGWTVRGCVVARCSGAYLTQITNPDVLDFTATGLGLTRPDKTLGYVPRESFDARISDARGAWVDAQVSITPEGLRANDNQPRPTGARLLAVGDSFTFGAQVSNHETWPACLERRLSQPVDNGGVFGYGAAQAVRRAMVLSAQQSYHTAILSVLVGADLIRDRHNYLGGYPRPAVIRTQGRATWAPTPDPMRAGTKYNPLGLTASGALYQHSLLAFLIAKHLIGGVDVHGDRLTVVHPDAADEDVILDFVLAQLAQLNVTRKVLVLQYASDLDTTQHVIRERRRWLAAARDRGLTVVDTLEALKGKVRKAIWRGHHTPRGNEIVCTVVHSALMR
ncbi:MAG: hypothetical protein R3D27_11305 [Hyphomicrobiaceae bacterium]